MTIEVEAKSGSQLPHKQGKRPADNAAAKLLQCSNGAKKKTTLRKWKEPTAKCKQNCERSFLNKKE